MKMYNLYNPATRILNAYKWQFPLDNFAKIRDFIIDNFEMNDNFEMDEMEQISNTHNWINFKDDLERRIVVYKNAVDCIHVFYFISHLGFWSVLSCLYFPLKSSTRVAYSCLKFQQF